MDDEIWKVINEFPSYAVSNLGRLKRIVRPKSGPGKVGDILKPGMSPYPQVGLSKDGKSRTHAVHVLVCRAFHGPKPTPKHEVAHWDGDKLNARWDNLRWATSRENADDRVRLGEQRGERNGRSKLTEDDVREVRRLLSLGRTQQSIADRFGVCQVTISEIALGQKWAFVT
jgi:hypothetical protein